MPARADFKKYDTTPHAYIFKGTSCITAAVAYVAVGKKKNKYRIARRRRARGGFVGPAGEVTESRVRARAWGAIINIALHIF